MDIQYYGANCITINAQGVRIVVDDNLSDIGAKTIARVDDIALFTGPHADRDVQTKLTIDSPGDFEVSTLSLYGIPARAYIDEPKQLNNTMYRLVVNELKLLVTGHVFPELTDDELERIGMIDILVLPVGGGGYTIDPAGALSVIKKIEPKIVIPTHFDDKALHYPAPQETLQQALKVLGMEPAQTVSKLKVKAGALSDTLQLIVLERS